MKPLMMKQLPLSLLPVLLIGSFLTLTMIGCGSMKPIIVKDNTPEVKIKYENARVRIKNLVSGKYISVNKDTVELKAWNANIYKDQTFILKVTYDGEGKPLLYLLHDDGKLIRSGNQFELATGSTHLSFLFQVGKVELENGGGTFTMINTPVLDQKQIKKENYKVQWTEKNGDLTLESSYPLSSPLIKTQFWEIEMAPDLEIKEEEVEEKAKKLEALDAVVNWGNGKAYIFKDDEYSRWDIKADKVDIGYPKKIADGWPGVFSEDIDAVVNLGDGKAYFFKGDQYIKYDIKTDKVDIAYPQKIADGWPGVFSRDIDAVVNWGDGKVYFFKGDQYIKYDIKAGKADTGYPQKIADGWPGVFSVFSRKIDAAVNWGNGKVFIFNEDNYLRYDIKADKIDRGYPQKIADGWPGAQSGYLNKWMKGIPDNRLLSDLAIPGTHDSPAYEGVPVDRESTRESDARAWFANGEHYETQVWKIGKQLENGIRLLDVRISGCGESGKEQYSGKTADCFPTRHGVVVFEDNLPTHVLDPVKKFLNAHPSETVFMSIKSDFEEEYDKDNRNYPLTKLAGKKAFEDLILNNTNYSDLFFRKTVNDLWTEIPLGSVRGKIVLINRLPESFLDDDIAIDFSDADVQDEYEIDWDSENKKKHKRDEIESLFKRAQTDTSNKYYINFLSSVDVDVYPSNIDDLAEMGNKTASLWLDKHPGQFGVLVFMDSIDDAEGSFKELIDKLIRINFN